MFYKSFYNSNSLNIYKTVTKNEKIYSLFYVYIIKKNRKKKRKIHFYALKNFIKKLKVLLNFVLSLVFYYEIHAFFYISKQ